MTAIRVSKAGSAASPRALTILALGLAQAILGQAIAPLQVADRLLVAATVIWLRRGWR